MNPAKEKRREDLAYKLADSCAVSIVDSYGIALRGGWRDVSIADESEEVQAEMGDAIEYLGLRGMLERKPRRANIVKVLHG